MIVGISTARRSYSTMCAKAGKQAHCRGTSTASGKQANSSSMIVGISTARRSYSTTCAKAGKQARSRGTSTARNSLGMMILIGEAG